MLLFIIDNESVEVFLEASKLKLQSAVISVVAIEQSQRQLEERFAASLYLSYQSHIENSFSGCQIRLFLPGFPLALVALLELKRLEEVLNV